MLKAEVQYLTKAEGRPIYFASSAGREASFTVDRPMQQITVEINDARKQFSKNDLHIDGMNTCGFDLIRHCSRVTDFQDSGQIKAVYEDEIKTLLKKITGAYRVHIFDHTVRASDPELRELKQVREPATLVHNDYTAKSGTVCLHENLGADAETLSKGRFQIINIWRPLVDPVINFPLVLCDARSVELSDQIDAERRAKNHTGEISLASYNPKHRWYYFPDMRPDEVLLFKTFDSANGGLNRGSIHTSVDLADAPADAPPRESIETRAFVFYE